MGFALPLILSRLENRTASLEQRLVGDPNMHGPRCLHGMRRSGGSQVCALWGLTHGPKCLSGHHCHGNAPSGCQITNPQIIVLKRRFYIQETACFWMMCWINFKILLHFQTLSFFFSKFLFLLNLIFKETMM